MCCLMSLIVFSLPRGLFMYKGTQALPARTSFFIARLQLEAAIRLFDRWWTETERRRRLSQPWRRCQHEVHAPLLFSSYMVYVMCEVVIVCRSVYFILFCIPAAHAQPRC